MATTLATGYAPGQKIPSSALNQHAAAINMITAGQYYASDSAFGIARDGITQAATAINAFLAAVPDGGVAIFPKGTYLVGSQITYSGKKMTLVFEKGAKIKESGTFTTPILYLTNADGSVVRGLTVEGSEVAFVGANSTRYAVEVELSDDVVIEGLTVTGKSRGALIDRCDRAIVERFDFTGFATSEIANVNYHSALEVEGSDDVQLARINGRNCGSVLLVANIGGASDRGVVTHLNGRNVFDNGIYHTGTGWTFLQPVVGNDTLPTTAAGMKILGSENVVIGGRVDTMSTGYILGGYDADQGDGYSGHGSQLLACRAKGCGGNGFYVSTNGGQAVHPRDFVIALCVADGCGAIASTVSSIFANRGHYLKLIHNTVQNHLGTSAAIQLFGTSGNHLVGIEAIGNTVRNVASAAAAYGLYAIYNDGLVVDGQTLHNVPGPSWGMLLNNATDCRVARTRKIGTAGTVATIRLDTGTGNMVIDNPGCTLSDGATGTTKPQTYSATNVTTDRTFDADTVAVAELADIVGTLVADLRAQGMVV